MKWEPPAPRSYIFVSQLSGDMPLTWPFSKDTQSGRSKLLLAILFASMLAAWLLGINFKWPARVVSVCIATLVAWDRQRILQIEVPDWPLFRRFIIAFPICFCALIAIHEIASVLLGEQGIDFAIFTQVIGSIARTGQPVTTLIGPAPVHFMEHHFTPILYPLGWITALGIPAWISGILFHSLCAGLGLWAMWLCARELGFSILLSTVFVVLLCLNPSFRLGMLFGIHDETYALPLLGFGLYLWMRGRPLLAVLTLLLTALCKESFFPMLVVVPFALGTYDLHWRERKQLPVLPYLLVALVGLGGLILFFLCRPDSWGSFDPVGRISSIAQLGDLARVYRVSSKTTFSAII